MAKGASVKLIRQLPVHHEPADELQASEISRCLIQLIRHVRSTKFIQPSNFQCREASPTLGFEPFFVVSVASALHKGPSCL